MADGFVRVAPDSTGKLVDTTELTTGSGTVERQRSQLGGGSAAELAGVKNAAPAATEYGLVTRPVSVSADVTMQSAATATGNGTILPVDGYSVAAVQVAITLVATVVFELTMDGSTWFSALAVEMGSEAVNSLTDASGTFQIPCAGYKSLRARIVAYTSGSVTVIGRASMGTALYADSAPKHVAIDSSITLTANIAGSVSLTLDDQAGGALFLDTPGNVNTNSIGVNGVPHVTGVMIKQDSTSLTPKFATINTAASADLVALVAAKKIRVLSLFLATAAVVTVKFQSGGATDLTGAMSIGATAIAGNIVLPYNPQGHFETAAGAKLNIVLGSGVQVSGGLTYIEV